MRSSFQRLLFPSGNIVTLPVLLPVNIHTCMTRVPQEACAVVISSITPKGNITKCKRAGGLSVSKTKFAGVFQRGIE